MKVDGRDVQAAALFVATKQHVQKVRASSDQLLLPTYFAYSPLLPLHPRMGRLKQKGKAGAAKAYVTRSSAVKKLQCSLADFRRLCILKGASQYATTRFRAHPVQKGIFPREPRHKKRANKGSSAPTSFYYAKDIAYLAHEPVLKKLREHKAFAKKLSRALGRGEWSSAKSLEENRPTYRLDHIIKERCVYCSTFIDVF